MTIIEQIQTILGVTVDNQWGPKSQAALVASDANTKEKVQALLSVFADGEWGPISQAALDSAVAGTDPHEVMASSFADPADVKAFQVCKAEGHSDEVCFGRGDNGVGRWGDDCTAGSGPACALPPEDWQQFGARARRKKVLIKSVDTGIEVIAELKDTMPHKANITNGCLIDLNFDTVSALGLRVPLKAKVIWAWA